MKGKKWPTDTGYENKEWTCVGVHVRQLLESRGR